MPSNHFVHRRFAMSAGARAPQASPLGHAVQSAARAPLRAAAKVALAPRATTPPALRCRMLRSARLQRSTARISELSATLQTRLRGRRHQNPAHSRRSQSPGPSGKRASATLLRSGNLLDLVSVFSYVARYVA